MVSSRKALQTGLAAAVFVGDEIVALELVQMLEAAHGKQCMAHRDKPSLFLSSSLILTDVVITVHFNFDDRPVAGRHYVRRTAAGQHRTTLLGTGRSRPLVRSELFAAAAIGLLLYKETSTHKQQFHLHFCRSAKYLNEQKLSDQCFNEYNHQLSYALLVTRLQHVATVQTDYASVSSATLRFTSTSSLLTSAISSWLAPEILRAPSVLT